MIKSMRLTALGWVATLVLAPAADAASGPKGEWQKWTAKTEISNVASLQRGAANFMGYCAGCHSLGYLRYARMGTDLKIPEALLEEQLLLPGQKKTDYIKSPLAAADGEEWFGKAPPDLSLIARSKGTDYVYQFLKTFYVDPAAPSGVNNLALAGTSMPHVLSALQGLQEAKLRTVERTGSGGQTVTEVFFEGFELVEPGQLSAAEYDAFVRDTVNFLDYVGEPVKAKRISLGVWIMLFLLVFTTFSYLLYREYWRDVK
jgi:ubiquinol-cytochrome c reductase cytochrome c1 subunit